MGLGGGVKLSGRRPDSDKTPFGRRDLARNREVMHGKNKKYDRKKLLKIGSQYDRGDKPVRELAEEYGIPKTVVSRAKDVYKAYQKGKDEKEREMKAKIRRLKERIERLSSEPEGNEANGSSTVDLRDYARDAKKEREESKGGKEESSGWGWIAAGLGALFALGAVFFKDFRD